MKRTMLLYPALRTLAGAVLAYGVGAWAAGATGPVGPVGPVGPIGPTGPVGAAGADPLSLPPTPRESPVPRPSTPVQPSASGSGSPSGTSGRTGGNRIEVTGNTATGTRCAEDGTASVNSVDVSGARLEGRTVIVQGRNANDVRTQDCSRRTEPSAQGQGTTGQTNSIRIR